MFLTAACMDTSTAAAVTGSIMRTKSASIWKGEEEEKKKEQFKLSANKTSSRVWRRAFQFYLFFKRLPSHTILLPLLHLSPPSLQQQGTPAFFPDYRIWRVIDFFHLSPECLMTAIFLLTNNNLSPACSCSSTSSAPLFLPDYKAVQVLVPSNAASTAPSASSARSRQKIKKPFSARNAVLDRGLVLN